jgi:hypothetical protein
VERRPTSLSFADRVSCGCLRLSRLNRASEWLDRPARGADHGMAWSGRSEPRIVRFEAAP